MMHSACAPYLALVCTLLLLSRSHAVSLRIKEKDILDTIFKNYDVRIRPDGLNSTADNSPVVVTVNMLVRSLNKLDDVNMETSVQLTLRQSWTDSRLKYSSTDDRLKYVTINDVTKLWTPDLFISNEIKARTHDLLTPNVFLRVHPDGHVVFSTRLSLVFSCPMNLKLFPFDTQVCSIRIASYGLTTDDLMFLWKSETAVQIVTNLHVPKFTLSSYVTEYCNSKTITGEYSCLKLDMLLTRDVTYYTINVFLPSVMLVLLAYLTCWMHPNALTARVVLGGTTLVAMITLIINMKASSAVTSYRTAMDEWTGACLTIIFLTIVESAAVNFLCRSEENRNKMAAKTQGVAEGEGEVLKPLVALNSDVAEEANVTSRKLTLKQRANRYTKWFTNLPTCSERLDLVSRIVFPTGFALFVIFWLGSG